MEDINILLASASGFCQKGEFQQGIHLYSKYIEQDQKNPLAYYQRGKAYFKLKDYQAAQSDLSKAIALAPEDAELLSERGLVFLMAQKQEKAIDDFNKAVEMEPKNPYRYASRAFVKDRLNDLAGAKADYQQALALDPEDAISYNNLGLVLEKMGQQKQAQQHYEKASEIDPTNFGIRKSKPLETDIEVPQSHQKELNPLPKINKNPVKESSINFGGTLKSLLASKSEREEFWQFVKDKVFK